MSKDKRMTRAELDSRDTMAIMGDEDSVTGFLIAGRLIVICRRADQKQFPLHCLFSVFVPLASDHAASLCLLPRI